MTVYSKTISKPTTNDGLSVRNDSHSIAGLVVDGDTQQLPIVTQMPQADVLQGTCAINFWWGPEKTKSQQSVLHVHDDGESK